MKTEYLQHEGAEISVENTSITVCKEWLEALPEHQRNVKKGSVKAFARDLKALRWTFNGATICFDASGALIDGQHRLLAFIEADTFPSVIVVRGLTADAYSDIDSGISRTYSDAFKHAGIPSYAAASSACNAWKAYGAGGSPRTYRASKKELLEAYEKHAESITWALYRWASLDGLISQTRRVFLCSYAYERMGEELTNSFFNALEKSVGSQSAIAFRKVLVRESNKTRGKIPQDEVIALGLKAMKAHSQGRQLKVLRWLAGEPIASF